MKAKVNIDNTRFIFDTNFSGDPNRDRYGSSRRRVNVVVPTQEQAQQLIDMGVGRIGSTASVRICNEFREKYGA